MEQTLYLMSWSKALYACQSERNDAFTHHSDRESQYASIRYGGRVGEAGI